MKKFVTLIQIVEQVSFFDYVFFILSYSLYYYNWYKFGADPKDQIGSADDEIKMFE